MSELSHADKARLKESYPGMYVVVLNFEDMITLRQLERRLAMRATYSDGSNRAEILNELGLVKQMIKDAES